MNHSILIDTGELLLHPFRAEEMKRFESLTLDLHQLFHQNASSLFLPHKKLTHIQQTAALLQTVLLHQYNGSSQWFFITQKNEQRTIGIIEIISPTTAQKHYQLDQYPYFLEFCLCAKHSGKGIMSSLLPNLIQQLQQLGIREIGAVAHPQNKAAIRVLEKSGISRKTSFDAFQHLYLN